MKMNFKIILVGGLAVFFGVFAIAVFLPGLMTSTPTTIAHPYTDEQLAGRRVYYSNGCIYCHTQYVRGEDTAMGAVSVRGNYAFDLPLLFGSERTGPDLSYIGRKRSAAWDIAHLREPRELSPLSIMPSFEFLSEEELEVLAAYLFALGDRVAQERMIPPPPPYEGKSDPSEAAMVGVPEGGLTDGWAAWRKGGFQDGKELYVARCMPCHGCAGNGLGGYAGTMSVTPADFTQEPYRSMPADQWFWHVSEGLPGTLMPTWEASLSESRRWSVIRYVRTIFSEPVMRDPLAGRPTGDYAGLKNPLDSSYSVLDEGKTIYTRDCMICHGVAGRGDGIYSARLQPPPPDFADDKYGTLFEPIFTDADYYWRISEGLPWTAMPPWKIHYSSDDRWKLVHYVRTALTRTEFFPQGEAPSFEFPETYKTERIPEGASFARGRAHYLRHCAHCHGLAGDGAGTLAAGLVPPPFDFRVLAGMKVTPEFEAEYHAMMTFSIPGSAMPVWAEFLPERERWDILRYLLDAFVTGRPSKESVETKGTVPAEFATISEALWLGTGHEISTENGTALYAANCATCHGSGGAGSGPGAAGGASGGPAAFPPDLPLGYVLWRVAEGVPGTTMYAFGPDLSEAESWDVAMHVRHLTGGYGGGGS